MRRLFVGIAIDEPAILSAVDVLQRLRTGVVHQAVRWVRPEKLHLTLVFLGHVAEGQMSDVERAVAAGCDGQGAFTLTLTTLGGFPDLRRPKTVWLGTEESSILGELQKRVAASVGDVLKLEDRAYHPHVTLGRVSPGSPAVGSMVRTFGEEVGNLNATWTVTDVRLYESMPDGSYEVRLVVPLG